MHRLVVLTFGNHEEPRSGIASLTMYDVTMFTFREEGHLEVTELKRQFTQISSRRQCLFDIKYIVNNH